MADWNGLNTSDLTSTTFTKIKDLAVDAGTMGLGSIVNTPTGFIRLNRTSYSLEEWSGAAWVPAVLDLSSVDIGALSLGDLATLNFVNTAEIADGAVSAAKAGDGWGGLAFKNQVATGDIEDGAVTYVKKGTGWGALAGLSQITNAHIGETISVGSGGTGANTIGGARASLQCAKLGSNSDITELLACVNVVSSSTLNLYCQNGQDINFVEDLGGGAVIKAQIPAGKAFGSVGLQPGINNWFTLGKISQAWQTVFTVGVKSATGTELTLASSSTQHINIRAGDSATYWRFKYTGELEWLGSPTFTKAVSFTRRYSLDPGAATNTTNADAINTIWEVLGTAGLLKVV